MNKKEEEKGIGSVAFIIVIASIQAILFLFLLLVYIRTSYRRSMVGITLDQKKAYIQQTVDNLVQDLDDLHDALPKEQAERLFRQSIDQHYYGENSYIWVKKVLNYEGGDNYAVTLMHPRDKSLEGKYLSTKEQISGMFYNQEELKGILENGQVFTKVVYRNDAGEEVDEKIIYSKLYKPYNWVISMDLDVEDIKKDVHFMDKTIQKINYRILFVLGGVFTFVIVSLNLVLFYRSRRKYVSRIQELSEENAMDELTGAKSRKAGKRILEHSYNRYKTIGVNAKILMMDVDYFKSYNDRYGHSFGDQCLQHLVKVIQETVRSSDDVIRWGGDEFLCVLYDLNDLYAEKVCNKICEAVASHPIKHGEEELNMTVSIGYSGFHENDEDAEEVVKRADRALYDAKYHGRNQAMMYDEENDIYRDR